MTKKEYEIQVSGFLAYIVLVFALACLYESAKWIFSTDDQSAAMEYARGLEDGRAAGVLEGKMQERDNWPKCLGFELDKNGHLAMPNNKRPIS